MAARAWFLGVLLVASCAEPRERIVLITLDALRADALAWMPQTRALLAGGTSFVRAYSSTSATQPTHASLFTGLHPWEHGLTRNGQVLPDELTTLAEQLAANGFDTAAVVSSFPLERRFGFAQGFEHYADELDEPLLRQWEHSEVEEGHFYSLGEKVTDEALAALEVMDGSREFLWVHYFDAHDPYGDASASRHSLTVGGVLAASQQAPGRAAGLLRLVRNLYQEDVQALDRSVARLLEGLERDTSFRTHVILTADHGESLGERGFLGHGNAVVPEQVHVPLAILSPEVRPGERQDTVGSVDVAATILTLAGIESGGRGRSLTEVAEIGTQAVGMRCSHDGARSEPLLDGRELTLSTSRFYVTREGRLFFGNGQEVLEFQDPTREPRSALGLGLRAVFAGFERSLAQASTEVLEDEETRRGLEALGYGR